MSDQPKTIEERMLEASHIYERMHYTTAANVARAWHEEQVTELRKERDYWKASRNAILAATNEATQRYFDARGAALEAQAKAEKERDEAMALLRRVRDPFDEASGISYGEGLTERNTPLISEIDALLNGPKDVGECAVCHRTAPLHDNECPDCRH